MKKWNKSVPPPLKLRRAGRRFCSTRGFTLIEVLAAVVIMGVAFAVIAQGLISASNASVVSQAYTRAVMVAASKMAEVEAGAYPLNQNFTEKVESDTYTFDVTVTPVQTDRAGLYEVTVEVKWTMSNREHKTVLTRLLHEALRKKE